MRSVPTLAAVLAFFMLVPPALAFDVQNGGGGQAGGSASLAPDASSVPGVSLDTDLRAQLGLAEDKAAATSKSGLQFGGGVFTGSGSAVNSTSMSYDERPWVAPRTRPGH
ncbi:MAG: hypothetical protein K8F92_12980 [Hyphomicrobium sp.]|uniref:hypothetical protein n=1 Tax=Hyphomicrobium sp. TaxID=82 RepID=UPI0022BCC7F9|nr:hypothetical protein [Hyphomicrobium sp.]MBZ0210554.1 hypothetical protein [Hyphomicrobium sp.]MCZ7595140.1 hypothetical protein [Hyphomicrobium sp.]